MGNSYVMCGKQIQEQIVCLERSVTNTITERRSGKNRERGYHRKRPERRASLYVGSDIIVSQEKTMCWL